MNVFCEQNIECTVVTVEGDLCIPESDNFREFLMHRIGKGMSLLLIDFSRVTYVDSSGISALLSLLQTARKTGGDIRLAGLNKRITDLFRQVGLHHVFRRFESKDEGVDSFKPMNSIESA